MNARYAVPGVYYEPRPRAQPRPLARTDVVGFVGFEPRVQDSAETPSHLVGSPPVGHDFRVDVLAFQLPEGLLGAGRTAIPPATGFVLSQNAVAIPLPAGGSITYTLVGLVDANGVASLAVAVGAASATSTSAPPTDVTLQALAAGQAWVRLFDVEILRSADGLHVAPTVVPRQPPTRCDDWRDFELQLGGLPAVDDGTLLARSIRAYFANGGARCHVVTFRRPRFDDAAGLARALVDLVGMADAPQADATGFERLLRIYEVAIADVPDLYARSVIADPRTQKLPPPAVDACFRCCGDLLASGAVDATGQWVDGAPLFADADVLAAQRALLVRCAPERWRVCLLLAAPVAFDTMTGVYRGPTADRSIAWRQQLAGVVDDLQAACAAFYHPWALTQERIGATIFELPPTALAAGVLARRDLARGPHVSAANERLIGVVGLSSPVDEATNARIYPTPLNINPLRALPGQGIQVWGARTLSGDRWMRFLAVRRCLSAIERRMMAALRPLVFEPNTPTLWFQITQAALGVLTPVFTSGALRGDTAEQSFYVRCDAGNNPPESIADGRVVCEVGVAIAAPAEFIVFRVGRREAVVELLE